MNLTHVFADDNPANKKRMPSLIALRAFHAASRTGNYTRAAEELFLTQSAISKHVRNLELDLGFALFLRRGRNMTLTPAGHQLKVIVSDAFDRLFEGIDTLCTRENSSTLTVSLLASLAAQWLAPRIGEFSAENPDIDLNIHCTRAFVSFQRDKIDMAIRYGEGNWVDCNSELLMHEEISIVCSPDWQNKLNKVNSVKDLAGFPLLHGDNPDGWSEYFRASGVSGIDASAGPVFSDDNALLKAAIQGQGLMIGRSILVEPELEAGRLIEPFDVRFPATYSYWLVTPSARALTPKEIIFKDFLLEQANVHSKKTE